jgi:hypothetical protein
MYTADMLQSEIPAAQAAHPGIRLGTHRYTCGSLRVQLHTLLTDLPQAAPAAARTGATPAR